jgi:hypothetical protein
VGVGNGRGHKESKALIIGDLLVAQPQNTAFIYLLQKYWLKRWVHFLSDIFNKHPFAELNTQL